MAILDEMFSDTKDPAAKAERLESFKTAMSDSIKATDRGDVRFDRANKTLVKAAPNARRNAEVLDELLKSANPDVAKSLGADLEQVRAEIRKEWTPSSPINGGPTGASNSGYGMTTYDLESPAKQLVPQYTTLRNSTPRKDGKGTAHQFKRITSYTNAGIPNGAASQLPFFSSSTQTNIPGQTVPSNVNGPALLRPPTISYTGDSQAVAYVELGFSDYVAYLAQFEALGFDDLRGLSHTALLWSHLMGEERAMLYARGASSNGYSGTLSAPTGVALVATTGTGSIPEAADYYVYVTANSGTGESTSSSVASTTGLSTGSGEIAVSWTDAIGALSYNVYVGTTTGQANAKLQLSNVVGNSVTLTSYSTASSVTAPTADNGSASSLAYDGYLTVLSNPTVSGYVARKNGTLNTNLSDFDTAFATMYQNNGADPEEIQTTAAIRSELNQILREGGASNGYRVNLTAGESGATLGTIANGYVNPNTGNVVDIKTHRFMPAGVVMIRSTSLNVPNSNVAAPTVAVNVQDYMAIDWPDIQMTYDTSTYQVGTLVHYAPQWSGVILGVQ